MRKTAAAAIVALWTVVAPWTTTATGQFPSFDQSQSAAKPQFGDSRDQVTVSVTPAQTRVAPGSDLALAIIFDHKPGWHIWTNKRERPDGVAEFEDAIFTRIEAGPDSAGHFWAHEDFIQWPDVHTVNADVGEGPQKYAVFSGRAVAFLPITIAADAPPGKTSLQLLVSFQTCNDETCLRPVENLPLQIEVEIDATASGAPPQPAELFTQFDAAVFKSIRSDPAFQAGPRNAIDGQADSETSTGGAGGRGGGGAARPIFFGIPLPSTTGALGLLLLALLSMVGGFILNLTPCVLPIIPIKIMTISQHAGTPGRSLALGMWMAAGVVAFWTGIGIPAALITSAADPSRLFGIWWLTLGVGVVIFAMGVGIMGLFQIQLPQSVYAVNPKADTAWGSFMFGIMTAVLGLPCFGFVAGALLAGAATLPAATIMVVFTSLGIGMASPYLVLSAKPGWVNRIPRTGPASELVKQVMGLLLLAAAAYFIGSGLITLVIDHPYVGKQLHWWIVALFAVAAGFWLVVRTVQITTRTFPRIAMALTGLLIGAVAVSFAINSTSKARAEWTIRQASEAGDERFIVGAWNDYSPRRFENARKAGHVVVLDFTASWCLTCQVLRATVLNPEPVKSAFEEDDVVVFEVDLSSVNAPGWDHLRDLGKTGIPLLAIYAPGNDAPWQANAYTADQVIAALDAARARTLTRR